ncbi:MAG TPA: hypothetical protein VEB60_01565, partial [Candidatus Paceibacterota bacterium]|nr:hypothetical protein [Candidatus Paceibacterota bacterium]
PRYDSNFFGRFIGECLRGDYGNFVKLDPRIASVLYAADRWEAGGDIARWLSEGYVVIADRYVSSNQIHQGGKIKDPLERRKFLSWLSQMEYGTFKIPKPHAIVYLDVPLEVSRKLLKEAQAKKTYLQGKKDTVERNLKYGQDSRESAMRLIEQDNQWHRIECVEDGKLLSPESVHEKVLSAVKRYFK